MSMFTKILCTLVIASLSYLPYLSSQTYFVKNGGSSDGSSWNQAAGSLASILDNAVFGDEIWVAEGIYYPVDCTSCTFTDRQKSFEIPNGVKVYGGFAGWETALDQRNIQANPTLLSGDINKDGTIAFNSFTVVLTRRVSESTIIDGFTITFGNADNTGSGIGTTFNSGGGWFNDGELMGFSSHPIIRNCTFLNNRAFGFGGGFYNNGGFGGEANPILENCQFVGNIGQKGGGGMYNNAVFNGEASPKMTDCLFEGNSSGGEIGGAVVNNGSETGNSHPQFVNCEFIGNSSGDTGGAIKNLGNKSGACHPIFEQCLFQNNQSLVAGAVYNEGNFSGICSPTFAHCEFIGNKSTSGDAGAIYNSGIENGHSNPTFSHCNFFSNESAAAAGVIFSNGINGESNPIFMNCRFFDNLANTYGGAIYNMGKSGKCNPHLTNCLIFNNTAISSAGGMYNLGAEGGESSPVVTNCTFYGNTAVVGGAIYNNGGDATGKSSPIITNCIIWGNQADFGYIFRNIWGTPNISHSLVDANECEGINSGNNSTVNCGEGMIFNQDPKFKNIMEADFHLLQLSPAVDAGDNVSIGNEAVEIDLDGLERIHNGTVDFGVFEYGAVNNQALQITLQPVSKTVCEGAEVIFEINVTGSGTLSFQWQKDGQTIMGATSSSYIIETAIPADIGNYSCLISNGLGVDLLSETAFLSVIDLNEAGLTIEATTNEICAGEEITFSTIPVNGGGSPIFQWQINGNNFGANIPSFTISQLNDGDVISCEMTSTAECLEGLTAQSNELLITVHETLEVIANLEVSEAEICAGENVTFTTIPINGGAIPNYQWQINGNDIENEGSSFTTNQLLDQDIVTCNLISSEACVQNEEVVSNEITMTVNDILEATISIDATTEEACEGEVITFSTTFINEGDAPSFTWKRNDNILPEDSDMLITSELNDNDVISCTMLSSATCVQNSMVISNEIEMTVHEVIAVELTLESNLIETCEGEPVTFTALPENGGVTPIFNWFVNGGLLNHEGAVLVLNNLEDQDEVQCEVISSAACTDEMSAFSDIISISVVSSVEASVMVNPNIDEICEGEEIVFTAMPLHEGQFPVYEWFVNGALTNETSSIFTSLDWKETDEIFCQLTSSNECVVEKTVLSEVISIAVSPILEANISIESNAMAICEDTEVSFSAVTNNGGTTPIYQWLINGNLVGDNASTFNSNDWMEGDEVVCLLTSSANCIVEPQVMSNEIELLVSPTLMPSIHISFLGAQPFCVGDTILFEAAFEHGGDNPAFEWTINGQVVGENTSTFLTTELANADVVQCTLLSSANCLTSNPIPSDGIVVEIDSCTVSVHETTFSPTDIKVYPNPTQGQFNIEIEQADKEFMIEIYNLEGNLLGKKYFTHTNHPRRIYSREFELPNLSSGVCLVRYSDESFTFVKRLIVY